MSLVAKGNRLSARYTDLAARRLGGQALSCSNDFFAEMENLLKAEAPIFQPGVFTERGQLMDGWESRRRRFLPDGSSDDGLQFDWCIIERRRRKNKYFVTILVLTYYEKNCFCNQEKVLWLKTENLQKF